MFSIRYKALLPMGLLALVQLALILTATFALSDSIGLSRNLASRYREVEELKNIEVRVGDLMAPLVSYLEKGSLDSRAIFQRNLEETAAQVHKLRTMAVVNAEEREILNFVDEKIGVLRTLSDTYFSTSPSEHSELARKLDEITREHLTMLGAKLHDYRDDEIHQVDALVRDAESVKSSFRVAGFAAVAVTLALFGLAVWVNDRVLIRPILSISQSTSNIAGGRLQAHLVVASNDELGQLARDISVMAQSLQAMYLRMEKLAHADPLTGLMNRRAFDEAIERELEASHRYSRPFGVVMVDVDHFKCINDTYGHGIGDEVLKFVAQTCSKTIRASDTVFRIGGEEFVLLLKEVGQEEVWTSAERLRRALADRPWANGQHTIRVTASFGVVYAPLAGKSRDALMKAADVALYKAKTNGRNRVEGTTCTKESMVQLNLQV